MLFLYQSLSPEKKNENIHIRDNDFGALGSSVEQSGITLELIYWTSWHP